MTVSFELFALWFLTAHELRGHGGLPQQEIALRRERASAMAKFERGKSKNNYV